jgi:site-specific recombinase XerD
MKQVVERLWALRHEPKGPLVPYLDSFANYLDRQGYKRHLLGRQIRVVANFSQWLQAEQITAEHLTGEDVRRFFDEAEYPCPTQRGECATLRHFIDFLSQLGVTHLLPEHNEATPIQHAVDAYTTYLRQDRELCDKTLIQYRPFAERFLFERFGQGAVEFAALQAGDVIEFVKRQTTILSPARAKAATTALRSFLRYLRYCGEIQLDLAAAVPTVPNWSVTGIPRAIAPAHLQAVFAHCPRDTPVGRRDYAILMLLARLGLRAGEIVSLTLDSIDWETGSIAVVGKGNQAASMPLSNEVGEAIGDYLRYGRPSSNSRALFLRACAPIRGLGAAQTVSTIVGAAIKRAGIETPHRGTHQFRHALATDMLRHGATLTEIGSVLRHRHAKTTSLYAKVDFAALRPLALPWPGGAK